MPRELVTIQVGQCGNQIGCRFWELALREHAAFNKKGVYDDALSSFFRNVDTRVEPPRDLPVGLGDQPIRTLKARSVIVDMEEGVINNMLKGPLGDILDTQLLLSDVSGAGNNWAHGHYGYGPQYRSALHDRLQTTTEACDSLQSFLLLHSLGGGTGSGLGSYILGLLKDEYPETFRFTASVFPSEDDDVITSPYNALMALSRLIQHADCVLPIENQALMDITSRLDLHTKRTPARTGSTITGTDGGSAKGKAFDAMNGVAANLLLNLTSSVRFEGSLNVDLNDITMNMVPFPRMHFLLSAMSPLAAPKDVAKLTAPRTIDQVISEVFSREHQLIRADPRRSTYLACGLLARGAISISDINRNISRIRPSLRMAHWNSEGFKLGICNQPPVGVPYAALCLANNCCIRHTFAGMHDRFMKLFKRRLYVHHYEQYMEGQELVEASELLQSLMQQYADIDDVVTPPAPIRIRPRGLSFFPPT